MLEAKVLVGTFNVSYHWGAVGKVRIDCALKRKRLDNEYKWLCRVCSRAGPRERLLQGDYL